MTNNRHSERATIGASEESHVVSRMLTLKRFFTPLRPKGRPVQNDLFLILPLLLLLLSCNPFAPKLDESSAVVQFGDAHTVPGFFQAFKYAYEFKDTTTYGALLAPDFTFSYRNYDQGVDYTWGRDEEMRTTGTLFDNAEAISLQWGNILDSSGTQTSFDVTISFSLDITFNAGDIEHVDGRAVFHLERSSPSDIWRAGHWQDESNL